MDKTFSPTQAARLAKQVFSQGICDQLVAELLPLDGIARNYQEDALAELICRHYSGMGPAQAKRMTAEELVPFLSKIAEKVRRENCEIKEPKDLGVLVTAPQLADRYSLSKKQKDRLRKRLEAYRKDNFDGGWVEVRDRKPREPKFLYPAEKITELVKAVKASA